MSYIRVKSTELHFFFVKIVTVLIFTFTTSSSFNYVFSGSADVPAISNNTLLKTIIFIFVGEVLNNKYFSDKLGRSFFKLYLFFHIKKRCIELYSLRCRPPSKSLIQTISSSLSRCRVAGPAATQAYERVSMGWWLLRLSAKILALLRLSVNFFSYG